MAISTNSAPTWTIIAKSTNKTANLTAKINITQLSILLIMVQPFDFWGYGMKSSVLTVAFTVPLLPASPLIRGPNTNYSNLHIQWTKLSI
jgi:hypothetical protein